MIGLFVLVVILAFKHGTKGMLSNSAVLIGIICGLCLCMILPCLFQQQGLPVMEQSLLNHGALNWDKWLKQNGLPYQNSCQ